LVDLRPLISIPKGLKKYAILLIWIGFVGTCVLYYGSPQSSVNENVLNEVRITSFITTKDIFKRGVGFFIFNSFSSSMSSQMASHYEGMKSRET